MAALSATTVLEGLRPDSTDNESTAPRRPGRGGRPPHTAALWIGERAKRISPHTLALAGITVGFAILYCWYSLTLYWRYQGFGWDLAIFDQAVRGYSHFGLPHVPVLKASSPTDPGVLQLADHFSPILVVLAPLYWIRDSPETLLIAQGALLAASIPVVWRFARRAIGAPAAYPVALAYALYWPLQSALAFDFHEAAFAPLLIALMLERAQAGRIRQALAAAALLLCVKEDMGLVVAMFGVYLAVQGRRRLGLCVGATGTVAVAVLNFVYLPLAGSTASRNWSYGELGPGPTQAAVSAARHPVHFLGLLVADSQGVKSNTLLWLLVPVLFVCFWSPIILLAVPLVAERFLSTDRFYWETTYHYNSFVAAIVFIAAIDAASRMRSRRWTVGWAVATAVIAVLALPRFDFWNLTDPTFRNTETAGAAAAERALAQIPDGVRVAAYGTLAPHLSSRTTVLSGTNLAARPDWIIVPKDPAVIAKAGSAYRMVYDKDGWMILKRTTP